MSRDLWYADGLRFDCTRCGRCCTGATGYVWTNDDEIRRLATATGLSLDEFGRRHLRRIGARYALTENAITGDCSLLSDGLCSVHDARPGQCRSFPFWPANLESEERWRAAAVECEGIVLGDGPADEESTVYTRELIDRLQRQGPRSRTAS